MRTARALAHCVLTEFVEAAEPKRQKKTKRRWWWNPRRFVRRTIEFWPTEAGRQAANVEPAAQIVVLPPYGARR